MLNATEIDYASSSSSSSSSSGSIAYMQSWENQETKAAINFTNSSSSSLIANARREGEREREKGSLITLSVLGFILWAVVFSRACVSVTSFKLPNSPVQCNAHRLPSSVLTSQNFQVRILVPTRLQQRQTICKTFYYYYGCYTAVMMMMIV